jgi:hypothetical protein
MVYAMMSIGILGFIVWSWFMASSHSDMGSLLYFAICWNSLTLFGTLKSKNPISYTQSAGNLSLYSSIMNIKQSASETTRETSFDFVPFYLYYNTFFKKNGNQFSKDWLTWFIGFIEGDGAIQTYDNNKRVRFVLTQKESAILYHIQNKFGLGKVKHFPQGISKNKNDFYRWIVDNPSEILLLAFLFNGNLAILHRIKQLNLWIQALNSRFGERTITFKNNPVSITLNDAWISGFTDAEGCFNVSILANTRYSLGYVIKMRYILDQKDSNILEIIRNLFKQGKVSIRTKTDGVYRYTVTGFKSCNTIKYYFFTFPLFTKKGISFNKWSNFHEMVLNKLHLTKEGLKKAKTLQKQININNSMTNKTGSANP